MLKILSDKVIIDGHEQTSEQCETMTLLANALSESKDFRQVEYRNGYAEFEKVGRTGNLKFVADTPNVATTELTIGANIAKVVFTSTSSVTGTAAMSTFTASDSNAKISYYNDAYRTITFETAPTSDLLTWLQANGTKQ